jgi:hypothetical protein
VELDHVVLGVADLDAAAAHLRERFGLLAAPGGRHPGWGTANRVVPLGDSYVELVTVVDPVEAARSPFGRWVAAMLAGGPAVGWAVRTDDIAAVAARLGLQVAHGSRTTAAGARLSWQIAGIEQAAQEPGLPFFIQWGPATPHPGRAPIVHPAGAVTLVGLVVEVAADQLEWWLGGHIPGVATCDGVAGVDRVLISTRADAPHLLVDHGLVGGLDQGEGPTTP